MCHLQSISVCVHSALIHRTSELLGQLHGSPLGLLGSDQTCGWSVSIILGSDWLIPQGLRGEADWRITRWNKFLDIGERR